jgi:hypothetical protein
MSEPAKVFEDREIPGQWRVEWFDDDGRCQVEVFTGPTARRQALRYAYAEIRGLSGGAARAICAPGATLALRAAAARSLGRDRRQRMLKAALILIEAMLCQAEAPAS